MTFIRAHIIFLIVLSLSSIASAATTSQISGMKLSADSISRDYETKMLVLEGNVEIAIDKQSIRADRAEINLKSKDVFAKGQVRVTTDDTYIEGSELKYNLSSKLAHIKSGFVQSGQVAFEGAVIEKTGDLTYVAEDATYTACLTCPPVWSFSGQKIEAEMGGYAYIKYPVLRLGHFPVFILPRLIVPLKSARQSGLLVPSLSFSEKGGAAISQSYFWAIDKSRDMTVTLKQFEKRGLKTSLEHRFILSSESRGVLQSAYIDDRSYTVDGQPSKEAKTLERGFIHYEHSFALPDNFVQRLELNYITDLRYVRDFSEDLEGAHGDPALTNNVSLAKNSENLHSSIDASFYVNLIQFEDATNAKGDALSRNDDAVHRWPEIRFNFAEQEIAQSNLFWKLNFNYSHFVRRDYSYDDITNISGSLEASPVRDGTFDSNIDLIRTGHRTILEPTLIYPIRIGSIIDILPAITYNESQYRFLAEDINPNDDYEKNASLRYLKTDVSFKTIFSGIYGHDNTNGERHKHEIVPEIIYSEIPWIERPDHVFFGDFENQPYSRSRSNITNNDFRDSSRLQFDYKDRVFDKKLVTIGITNTVTRKAIVNGESKYGRIANFRVSQSYDFNEANRSSPNPWSSINSLLELFFDRFETVSVADYFPYANVTNWSSRVKFNFRFNNYIEIHYSDKIAIDDENDPITSTRSQDIGSSLGLTSKYADFKGTTSFSAITNEFKAWEYIAILKPPGDCWNIKFGHKKTAGSDIESIVSFNFQFGGA